jgi:hypothetical protein
MSKTASLTSGLVSKKGQAVPAIPLAPQSETKSPSVDYYKALTVKLDRERYESLKNIGVKLDKKSQENFVEALDLWLKKIVEPHA